MLVAVMAVGIVLVAVNDFFVRVFMPVPRTRCDRVGMFMLVVSVMSMPMVVSDRSVGVHVFVPFGQV